MYYIYDIYLIACNMCAMCVYVYERVRVKKLGRT